MGPYIFELARIHVYHFCKFNLKNIIHRKNDYCVSKFLKKTKNTYSFLAYRKDMWRWYCDTTFPRNHTAYKGKISVTVFFKINELIPFRKMTGFSFQICNFLYIDNASCNILKQKSIQTNFTHILMRIVKNLKLQKLASVVEWLF